MSSDTGTRPPDPLDFGITPEEYGIYNGKLTTRYDTDQGWRAVLLIGFSVVVAVAFVITRNLTAGFLWGIMSPIPTCITVWLVRSAILRFKRARLLASPVGSQVKLYQEALAAYHEAQQEAERVRREAERAKEEAERLWRRADRARWEAERPQREAEKARHRKLAEHWMSLSGTEFERQLGTVYRQLGYRVESTPTSGDGGIDLILRKNGKTIVVQCKGHQAPVGPAIARELLGSMVAFGADDAILACTGGFTQGVKEFVRGKRIDLVSASELATLGESVEGKELDGAIRPPICPKSGCGREMVPREGRHGRFWGCPRYPQCTGTRDEF